MRRLLLLLALCVVSLASPGGAQTPSVQEQYTKREVTIPMRDGVKLFTAIYSPKDTSKQAPFLMMRTPYSCSPYGSDKYRNQLGPEGGFTNEGYIFVYQDVRGRYRSEGNFQWMTPYIPDKKPGQTDESTDTWDTIEWLLKNVPNNNGKVGVYGTSFPGFYAAQTLLDPHPALAAVSPQAPMADNWMGDDMHHGGTFFLPHAMNFIAGFGKARSGPTENYGPSVFKSPTPDGYRFFLEMGPLKNALDRYNMNQIELWKQWMQHGDYDAYWQPQNVPQNLKKVGMTPVLIVGGWWDAEDLAGPLAIYRAIEKFNPRNRTTLVMGPWYHGSWNGGDGTSLHDISWKTKTGVDFRDKIQRPFFRHYLWGDVPDPNLPEVQVFDAGADTWRTFDQWPPKTATPRGLYPQADFKLAWQPAGKSGGAEESERSARKLPPFHQWISDPRKPVPASAEISMGMPYRYLIEDQRFVWNRPDVLAYETAPLTDSVSLAGPLKATLYVSTTGKDADFIVKLIDVYPDNAPNNSPRGGDVKMGGYQMLIRGEPMRAKYRKSWSKPEPLRSNRVEKIEFVLPDVCYTFQKGHRIMLQVHSTWFPVVDRNPQTFVNIYEANESDFQSATHRLYLDEHNPSHLEVTVLPSPVALAEPSRKPITQLRRLTPVKRESAGNASLRYRGSQERRNH